ncbi:F-box protein GID2-like [Chenopodium quinoa]|uniref:F-box protein GID2-like n=1 Tax=Chenopodium quinoa TaxID=63459 RepID=UPI000B76D0E8|nr:F-box protein GID2-like [Chenopodium quinoa]
MKRAMNSDSNPNPTTTPKKPKFIPLIQHQIQQTTNPNPNSDSDSDSQFAKLDENLLYEVFKHADGKTLATASCVSKQWNRTAQDERLWELICTRQWSNSINYSTRQLRSVVLALGGFRRLHALNHAKTAPASSSSAQPILPPSSAIPARAVKGGNNRLGKDEVHLSLSLLSIRFYEKMNSSNKRP